MGITRSEMFARFGVMQQVDEVTEAAYKMLEQQLWEAGGDDPHGEPWHVSFHASSFPGGENTACGRAAIYSLMDVPKQFQFSRRSRQFMDMGKDMEDQIVRRWHRAGFLLTPPPEAPTQYRFEDSDSWLTGSPDGVIIKPRETSPHVVDVKCVRDNTVDEMRNLIRQATPRHVAQLKVYIAFAHEEHPWRKVKRCFNSRRLIFELINGDERIEVCPQHGQNPECVVEEELERPYSGSLYYVSFDDPKKTFEWYYEYDEAFIQEGREILQGWKEHFLNSTLPQTNFQKKRWSHPFNWQWSKPEFPCQYCDMKKVCQEDHNDALESGKLINLEDSHAIFHGQKVRKDYSYEQARERVLRRWGLLDAA